MLTRSSCEFYHKINKICIRFSDHDTGTHWDWDFGDVSYNDYAKIFI